MEPHNNECVECGKLFAIFHKLKTDIPITLHDEKSALIVVDYKMKILPKSARETKEQFFGKKGWTLHSSNSSHQDIFFTVSSLHAVAESMKKKPEWVTIISDNGGHYCNSDLMMTNRERQKLPLIIEHAINRHAKLGFDISSGNDIETAISVICDRKKESMLKINYHWFEWSWPITGCLCARDISNLVPLPNDTGIQVKKLKKEHVKEQLESRGILKVDTNKKDLVKELEIELAKETLSKLSGHNNYQLNPFSSNDSCPSKSKNSIKNKKSILDERGGKCISKKVWYLLQGYFLEGNIDKSERHTAESMLFQLKKCVENGIFHEEEVPKLETIRNWISRYASQHRQEAAMASLK
ncbi:hypothetical protein Glove_199g142 [Diversispora epigaea]|uniref:Uncharacterized protein n=1 Tax=Diversispora epigaea TaxID=1348612 RepID=A0A397IMW0_9GLOM|nr:hypothetical protein Glove_199g142 [Diversispora epigaea]